MVIFYSFEIKYDAFSVSVQIYICVRVNKHMNYENLLQYH